MTDQRGLSRAHFLRLLAAGGAAAFLGAPARAAPPKTAAGRMITRAIPGTTEQLPIIGVGTWQTFDVGRDAAARAPLRQVLQILFDAGGSVVDSSPMYGPAEGVAGDLLAEMHARDRAFIATKVWTSGRDEGIAQMRESMRRFHTDRIDLMQVHNLLDWRTHLKTLRGWKDDGTVRYIGITHYTDSALPQLADIIGREKIDFVQLSYSLDDRAPEERLLPLCAERGTGVIANRPFGQGGMFRRVRGKKLPDWAAEFDCRSWAQFFLKYLVAHPAMSCAIPGTGKPEHMTDNVQAGLGRLPDEKQRRQMAAYWDAL
ncbi:MAG: aldo/keto reductase [Candidatus Eiseniibacteriota bacterium]